MSGGPAVRRAPGLDWLWVPGWRTAPPPRPASWRNAGLLVLGDAGQLGEEATQALARRYQPPCVVPPGEPVPAAALNSPFRVLCLGSVRAERSGPGSDPSWPTATLAASRRTYGSLMSLASQLARLPSRPDVRLVVLTGDLSDPTAVTGAPEQAILLGPALVMPQELPGVVCRQVDLASQEWRGRGAELAALLAAELEDDGDARWVSWRGGRRRLRSFEPWVRPERCGPSRLRPGGVYLVTGGWGEIGGHLSRWLAARLGATVLLVGRAGGEVSVECREALVGEIMQRGGTAAALTADVADREAMARVVGFAQERFGGLDGVFHAAGVGGVELFRSLSDATPSHTDELLRAKVQGLLVLDEVLPTATGLRVLISSLSTVLGGVGRADYVAAHAYVDAFATVRNRQRAGLWTCIDWDVWASPRLAGSGVAAAALAQVTIQPNEGLDVLELLLTSPPLDRVVVSTRNLRERLAGDGLCAHCAGGATRHRPLEEELAAIWRELLEAPDLSVDDDFFELGGDSLVAAQVSQALSRSTGLAVSLQDLQRAPTVAALARRLQVRPTESATLAGTEGR